MLEPGARAWGHSERGRLGVKIDNRTCNAQSKLTHCNGYGLWEQAIVLLPLARGWRTLHGGLAQDSELRSFSVYATIGGAGAMLQPLSEQ